MTEENKKTEEVKVEAEAKKEAPATPANGEARAPSAKAQQNEAGAQQAREDRAPRGKGGPGDRKGPRGKHGNKRRGRQEQEVSEYTEKVVQVRRVTKVVKGGKKLSFRVVVIIGNEKGKVGVGVGKASDVLGAIRKAISDAKKSVVEISRTKSTISHTVTAREAGANILLKPAAEGTGIIAGGTARIVLELAGVGDILAKSKGSKSPLNCARATVTALKSLRSFKEVAALRGISVKQMLNA